MHQPRKRTLTVVATLAMFGLPLSACTSDIGEDGAAADATATIVATTTQVGSIANQITECAGGHTEILMSAADDPHQFEASSAQMADMIAADLVVTNGLGLEASMQRSIENAVTDGAEVFELAPQLEPLPLEDEGHDHAAAAHGEDEHHHGAHDPHIWMDVSRMADGAELIGEKITTMTGDENYTSCGADVAEELRNVDAQIQEILASVESARLVTDHAAYGYFADRYRLQIEGVVIPGGSTDGEPSSQELTQLTELLKQQAADVLVTSKANNNRMIQALSEEADGTIPVVELYESAVGESGSEAETYQQAMLYNAEALAEALN
ncbi:metal ABC transporter substrate-binding protein [Enteractinococcus coprophilus]|uniref:Zinc/manganese transport system substrate-binding protein n=1 Tax=Enteractinococcus coprophilus TaxID=1027633 RepID=A0A542ZZT8_9MICC|nr:metal ABC transporter substrate-binding protein [Enteractinococcus coprophilus]TQL65861.1 zinc/manganese transport system substrate-binding protein [Enteractinococcus coprophilus]